MLQRYPVYSLCTDVRPSQDHRILRMQTVWINLEIIIILITSLELITAYAKKTSKLAKKTVQAVKSMITKASRNELLQNIKNFYRTPMLAITLATNNIQSYESQPTNTYSEGKYAKLSRHMKLNDEYDYWYQSHSSRTHNNNSN